MARGRKGVGTGEMNINGTGTRASTGSRSGSNGAGSGPGSGPVLKYDHSYFTVPAQDHKGHSVRLWCRVQPLIDHEIEAIMQSHNWPFKTKGDFVRWAIWEGVKRVEKMAPVPGSMIVVAEAIMASCRASAQWLAFKSSVDTTEQVVRALLESGNDTEAYKLLSNLKSQVMMLEEASWRDQWLGEFQKRFGHIYERARQNPVNLSSATRTGDRT
jgi:hypothetical protein